MVYKALGLTLNLTTVPLSTNLISTNGASEFVIYLGINELIIWFNIAMLAHCTDGFAIQASLLSALVNPDFLSTSARNPLLIFSDISAIGTDGILVKSFLQA